MFRSLAAHFGVDPESELCPDIDSYVERNNDPLPERMRAFSEELRDNCEDRIDGAR